MGGYIDLIKRLLIVEGRFSFFDISAILALPPLLMAGLAANCFVRYCFSSPSENKRWATVALVFGIIASAIAFGVRLRTGGGPISLLQSAANEVSYSFLPFCVLVAFPKGDEFLKLLKGVMILYIPFALHALYQSWVGFANFEINYLLSGYTRVTGGGIDKTRPFSTVSSPGSMAFTAGFLTCLIAFYKDKRLAKEGANVVTPLVVLGMILFGLAMFVSVSRTKCWLGLGLCFWRFCTSIAVLRSPLTPE